MQSAQECREATNGVNFSRSEPGIGEQSTAGVASAVKEQPTQGARDLGSQPNRETLPPFLTPVQRETLLAKLKVPLPKSEMFKAPFVVDRFNEVFGVDGWDLRFVIIEKSPVVLLGVFTAKELNIRREAFGGGIEGGARADEYKGACDALTVTLGHKLGIGNEVYKQIDPSLEGGRSRKAHTDLPSAIKPGRIAVTVEGMVMRKSTKKDSFILITCRPVLEGGARGVRMRVQCWKQEMFPLIKGAKTLEFTFGREKNGDSTFLKLAKLHKVNDQELQAAEPICRICKSPRESCVC
jgi:hypothetical protein